MRNFKKITFILFVGLLYCLPSNVFAQNLSGIVFGKSGEKKEVLIGANVQWSNSKMGVVTDVDGRFVLPRNKSNKLIVSFIGFKTDTIEIKSESEIEVTLLDENALGEVVVRGNSTIIDRLSPIQTEIITTKALAKAACCNLSESFETNASVSVNYADAVTGAKQIQMLGLSGQYVQTNVENIPNIRGLATTFGLNYIPGTWIQSIDLGKGVGSVVNGYESMVGQINVELQKPDLSEKVYVNTYVNSLGRGELNLHLAHNFKKKENGSQWSVGLLSHGSTLQTNLDGNRDNFYDLPKYNQINILNRWKYQSERMVAQFGFKVLTEDRIGGEINKPALRLNDLIYQFTNKTNRVEFFSKTAKLFPEKPYRGLGLIVNGVWHDSKSKFGFKPYDGTQRTVYTNLIYQDIIGNTNHSYKTGVSFLYDDYNETYLLTKLARTELVPGAFFEYTEKYLDKFTAVVGTRLDFHNLFGVFFTPRLHLLYNPTENNSFRLSAGRGYRVANPLAEYYGNLVSSRGVAFLDEIKPEVSTNIGLSYTRHFGKSSLVIDAYRTVFQNQLIADSEHPNYLYFYNSIGRKSFANSAQIELNLVPTERVEIKLAYRFFEVKQTLGKPFRQEIFLDKMFVNRDRILFNIGYALPYDKWKVDFTVQWNGKRRIPNLSPQYNHTSYETMPIQFAPAFYNVNAQVSRAFRRWDLYLGAENLTNFTQKDPIILPNEPFSQRFDAGMAWGPVVGRIIYFGTRYKLGGVR
ncbi:MAG: TonB-dependent receptor domain-containing protein [Spirosomataceae bacterium]